MGRNAAAARRGNAALMGLKANLKGLPTTLAVDVASRAGPAMTGQAKAAHAGRRSVYGESYPIGVGGQQLTLRKEGAVEGSLHFEVVGTVVRCKLGEKYAKYLIGKYGILPNGALPVGWKRQLDELVAKARVKL